MYEVIEEIGPDWVEGKVFTEHIVADYFKISSDEAKQTIIAWINDKRVKKI